jgi:hypothetical protein
MVSWYHESKPEGSTTFRPGSNLKRQGATMAQAATDDLNIPACELSLRIQLRRSGLRLRRSGFHYELIYGQQVLIAGNGRGKGLSLDEIMDFVERSLVR